MELGVDVTFWGVRGSIACPGSSFLRYGGNTSCVELQSGDHRVIFDAGTGIRGLGQKLLQEGPQAAVMLMSHTHWDHISGFPFFRPLGRPGYRFDIYSGHLVPPFSIRGVLSGQMAYPLFPVPMPTNAADLTFTDFTAGETLEFGPDLRAITAPLNHPDECTGYRVETGGRAVCYVTDVEHDNGEGDQTILRLIDGADLVIFDATYTDEDYPHYQGWGHSTWQTGVRLAQEAGVKRLVLFHHSPDREDGELDVIARRAEAVCPGTIVAREGMTLTL